METLMSPALAAVFSGVWVAVDFSFGVLAKMVSSSVAVVARKAASSSLFIMEAGVMGA
jgi:hypothetical protein